MVRNSATPHVHTQPLILKSLLKDQWPFKEEVCAFSTYWAWVPLNTIWNWRTWIMDHHLKGCSKAAVIASICHMRRESSNQTHPQTPPFTRRRPKEYLFGLQSGLYVFFCAVKWHLYIRQEILPTYVPQTLQNGGGRSMRDSLLCSLHPCVMLLPLRPCPRHNTVVPGLYPWGDNAKMAIKKIIIRKQT